MSKFHKIKNFGPSANVVSYAYFQAFKFPDSMNVHFQCVIQVCRFNCPEPVCPDSDVSPGLETYSSSQSSGLDTYNSAQSPGLPTPRPRHLTLTPSHKYPCPNSHKCPCPNSPNLPHTLRPRRLPCPKTRTMASSVLHRVLLPLKL